MRTSSRRRPRRATASATSSSARRTVESASFSHRTARPAAATSVRHRTDTRRPSRAPGSPLRPAPTLGGSGLPETASSESTPPPCTAAAHRPCDSVRCPAARLRPLRQKPRPSHVPLESSSTSSRSPAPFTSDPRPRRISSLRGSPARHRHEPHGPRTRSTWTGFGPSAARCIVSHYQNRAASSDADSTSGGSRGAGTASSHSWGRAPHHSYSSAWRRPRRAPPEPAHVPAAPPPRGAPPPSQQPASAPASS